MCSFYPSRVKRYRFVALSCWHTWVEGRILRGQQNKPIKGTHTIYKFKLSSNKEHHNSCLWKAHQSNPGNFPFNPAMMWVFFSEKSEEVFLQSTSLATSCHDSPLMGSGSSWRRRSKKWETLEEEKERKICGSREGGEEEGGLWGGKSETLEERMLHTDGW